MAQTFKGKASITCTVSTLNDKKEISQHIQTLEIKAQENIESVYEWDIRMYIAAYILQYGFGDFFD